MIIAIPKERSKGESRVAASPETVKKFIALGQEVHIEKGAGAEASIPDTAFKEAGAKIVATRKALLAKADIVLKLRGPETAAMLEEMKKGAVLAANLAPHDSADDIKAWAKAGITTFSMELMPRITRAQSMDVLSSQSNLAGYRAVIEAAAQFDRAFPMMMTAAGTIAPARIVVIGAGVAGLQAIATAKRLGAVVSAFDVRLAAKEQVQSLGGKFIEVDGAEDMETAAGYAKEAGEDYKKKQAEKLLEVMKKTDIVITTALIPGKPAPVIVTEEMVKAMPPGGVIVDLAAERGGNCPLTKADQIVEKHDIRIIGTTNMAGLLARDASQLYAKNLLNFFTPLIDTESGKLKLDFEDEILAGTCLTHKGKVVHPVFGAAKAETKTKTKAKAKAAPKKKNSTAKKPAKKASTEKKGA